MECGFFSIFLIHVNDHLSVLFQFSICMTKTVRNIDVALVSLLSALILGTFASSVYKQRSKYRQVKIMKHARADANKYSCSGPPAFKSGSCRVRFS